MTDEWGIDDGFHDVGGTWHPTSPDTRAALRAAIGDPRPVPPQWFVVAGDRPSLASPCDLRLEDGTTLDAISALPAEVPIGYHHLEPLDGGPATRLVVHPRAVATPARAWGVAAQVYSLWSEGSWGIGDLDDVAVLARRVAQAGGGAMLLSPLHAPAPSLPQEDSPYFPSSRSWWNPMLVRPRTLRPPTLECVASGPIDRDQIWPARRAALALEFRDRRHEAAWQAWADERGDRLVRFARWSALAEVHGGEWRSWPDALRRPDSPALDRTFAEHPVLHEAAEFHRWMQWRAWESVSEAGRAGAGVVTDLAVGFSPDGFDAWEYQDLLALQASVGAPTDAFNPAGQDWGLPPYVPSALAAEGFAPLIRTARAALHGASGLRVDHVMGLFRQFWIPVGGTAVDGAYVRYPGRHQLAILALEAERAGAYLVGEDLGTVEPLVREAMAELGMLGTLVAQFEERPPEQWRPDCMATLTTHDLPTITSIWATHPVDDQRRRNLQVLAGMDHDDPADAVVAAAHQALLASPPVLRLLTCEDLCGDIHRPNTPGTVGPHNWSTLLPCPVADIPLPDPPLPGAPAPDSVGA